MWCNFHSCRNSAWKDPCMYLCIPKKLHRHWRANVKRCWCIIYSIYIYTYIPFYWLKDVCSSSEISNSMISVTSMWLCMFSQICQCIHVSVFFKNFKAHHCPVFQKLEISFMFLCAHGCLCGSFFSHKMIVAVSGASFVGNTLLTYMHVCIYMCVCVCVCIYIYIYIYMLLFVLLPGKLKRKALYMYVCVCVCIYTCIYKVCEHVNAVLSLLHTWRLFVNLPQDLTWKICASTRWDYHEILSLCSHALLRWSVECIWCCCVYTYVYTWLVSLMNVHLYVRNVWMASGCWCRSYRLYMYACAHVCPPVLASAAHGSI